MEEAADVSSELSELKVKITMKETLSMSMKWIAVLMLILAGQSVAAEPNEPATEKDKLSYAVGVEMARSIEQQGLDLNPDVLLNAVRDVLSERPLQMNDVELRKYMSMVRSGLKQKRMSVLRERSRNAEANRKEGDVFLATNRALEGVVTLPSGLQYKIFKPGTGRIPTDGDTVEVQYRGTFVDGAEFDSSYSKGQAALFQVSGVIPGLREALKIMPAGSKWQVVVPSGLAYGAVGSSPNIGPHETLIYEIELLAIK